MRTQFTPLPSLIGGLLIGVSAAVMLVFAGRIAGITGILGGVLQRRAGDVAWRLWFLGGLVGAGMILGHLRPGAFTGTVARPPELLLLAGVLVGFGTRLGNGCTSGHGVCGIGRLSARSMVATAVFIATGALTVLVMRWAQAGGAR